LRLNRFLAAIGCIIVVVIAVAECNRDATAVPAEDLAGLHTGTTSGGASTPRLDVPSVHLVDSKGHGALRSARLCEAVASLIHSSVSEHVRTNGIASRVEGVGSGRSDHGVGTREVIHGSDRPGEGIITSVDGSRDTSGIAINHGELIINQSHLDNACTSIVV